MQCHKEELCKQSNIDVAAVYYIKQLQMCIALAYYSSSLYISQLYRQIAARNQ
jgi:hypothetical protein